jgi:lysophospholipase L1-like esterase
MKKNFIAIIIGIFVALLVAELTLRLQNYQYIPLKIKVFEGTLRGKKAADGLGGKDYRPYHEKEDQWVAYSSSCIWQPKKNHVIFNAQGFRGETVEKTKKPNEYRILAIGDSNTVGPVSSFGWVEYLGQLLQKKLENSHTMNAGVWGYSSWQGLMHFEEMIKYKPDLVLVSFGSNDAHRVAMSDREYISSRRFFKVVHHLRLCQLLMQVIDIWVLEKNPENALIPRVSLSEYAHNLNAIIDLAEKNKSKVILLTRPNSLHEGDNLHPLEWINFASQYNELTRKVAESREVGSIDIYSYFKDKEKCFIDNGHFSDEGHKIAGQLIYDHIIEILP